MVKPQFELGPGQAPKGVVRDPQARQEAVRQVASAAEAAGATVVATADSGLPGPKGNLETFLHLRA
jgi:23S rRNA (cytidine1920-2'-O)/16S rRNA (cytidine1409-2'-O)-methyltransferase